MKIKNLNNKGVSFVEIMVAVIILSALAAGILATFITARNMSALAFNKLVALNWAASTIEYRKSAALIAPAFNPAEDNVIINEKTNAACNAAEVVLGQSMCSYSVEVQWDE